MNQHEYTIATSGYRDCAAFYCFELAIGEEGALCWSCEESDCESDGDCTCEDE